MMPETSPISDDFAAFEAETRTAAQEAGKAEKRVMGINVPVGTSGKAVILSIEGTKSKVKTDPKTKQQTGGHPMIVITDMIETPEQHGGTKVKAYITLNETATQSKADKWQRFYDTMDDRGLPQELRGAKMADIIAWVNAEQRTFQYEVAVHWSDPYDKEFKPMGKVGALPSASDIMGEAAEAQFAAGQKVTAAGNPAEVVAAVPGTDKYKVKFASGDEMEVPVGSIQPA
jgi:hypothetical protein